MGHPKRHPPGISRTPAVMLQGTSSNAGKSVLAAALCRILLQDGYDVAPFKAQNMSLNSCVTLDGGEMGRAQVTQAQACRLEPDTRMNPILLKPSADTGVQVIAEGRPDPSVRALGDSQRTAVLFDIASRNYDSLAGEHEVMVLEGAGSPAEINLKSRDIANMRMARHAHAPVLLVGDIDRGGVFASFIGTVAVLDEWERRLLAGFVVNRLHGDAALLGNALEYTEEHTGRPVLGVVPFLHGLGLPEEDSVEFKAGAFDEGPAETEGVTIALVDLPHISNFTDLDALRIEPDVRVRVAREPGDLDAADAVILPGSKNTLHDLEALRSTGMAEAIQRLARGGRAEIVGICAGLQMLGERVADPHRVESTAGAARGMGLIPITTELAPEKTLRRVHATHRPSGCMVDGYEIHHGRTRSEGLDPVLVRDDGEVLGVAAAGGRVWGTYLHGVFDADAFRRWFVDRLRVRRGLAPLGKVVATYDLEPAFERLADVVRSCLDMDAVYRLMGLT